MESEIYCLLPRLGPTISFARSMYSLAFAVSGSMWRAVSKQAMLSLYFPSFTNLPTHS